MSVILIIREEIVCLLVLVFLVCFHSFYKNKDGSNNGKSFMKITSYGLCHVILDLITVITVNNLSTVPAALNKILHVSYFCFGGLFIMEFLDYVISLTMPYKFLQKYRRVKFVPTTAIIIMSFFLPMNYVCGRGTNYSYGPLLFACYGIFAVHCIAVLLLTVFKFKNLDMKTRIAVLPTVTLMAVMVSVQSVVPELLMTGAGVTFVSIGLFVTVDNPVSLYREQALWDNATGVRNKNSFQKQMTELEKKYKDRQLSIGFVICDMNGLKLINDNYGHAEGDRLIKATAAILLENLTTAYNVYRIGGDEFAVLYISPDDESVRTEMENVRIACGNHKSSQITLSVAMGYSSGKTCSSGFKEIYDSADYRMYKNKAEIKKLHPEFCR
ncbi:MAG: GGDEF domain-containing protein [Porcipelethomonas sp.]